MPRAGLTPAIVIERAAALLDAPDAGPLSFAALADDLGVRAPSLYKHVDGLAGLERGVMLRAKTELGHTLARATVGRSRGDAIRAMGHAYRDWALAHPGQYPLTITAPVAGDTEDERASASVLEVVTGVLVGYGLEGDDAIDAIRFLRASLHGFLSLETSHAFGLPVDIERTFARTIDTVAASFETWGRA